MPEPKMADASQNAGQGQESVDSPIAAEAKQNIDLPQEVKEQLPEDAQHIFLAAFQAAQSDGMQAEAARDVAWNSVKHKYEQGADGKWQRKPEDTNIHNKAIPSGGN